MPDYDDNITIVPKATSPSVTIVSKPTTPVATIVAKATRPTTTTVPKPYVDLLILFTEAGDDILLENGIPLTVEGLL